MKIAICNDHAGYDLKKVVMAYLLEAGIATEVMDFGCYSAASCDYPDFAHPMAEAVEGGAYDFGVAICGSGNGISMTANKHQGIRAGLCWTPELAVLTRQHNNANVLGLPARFIETETALKIVDAFFATAFEGGRHQARVDKIRC